jgi:hypothetical protein
MTYLILIIIAGLILHKVNRYSTNTDSNETANISINLDSKGRAQLTITDSSGRQITNTRVIKRVKQTERYKQEVDRLIQNRKKEIEAEKEKKRLQKLQEKKAAMNNVSEIRSKQNNN